MNAFAVMMLSLLLTGCTIGYQKQWQHSEKSVIQERDDLIACKEYAKIFAPRTSEEAQYIFREKEVKRCMQRKGYVWQSSGSPET
jgi:hypothetical protein